MLGGLLHKPLKFNKTRRIAWEKRQAQMQAVDSFLNQYDRPARRSVPWPPPPKPEYGRASHRGIV
ncbi:MAG: hypothetical protein Q8P67_05380 [archaeon]|nr:hypothetical protein [archaeon]